MDEDKLKDLINDLLNEEFSKGIPYVKKNNSISFLRSQQVEKKSNDITLW